jgi:HK97 family phage portal protein
VKILQRIFGKPQRRSLEADILRNTGLLEPPSNSGVTVTEKTALGVSAVFCAVNRISSDIGSLPLVLYKRGKDGIQSPAEDHDLYPILHDEPNPEATAPVFWESFVYACLLFGNGFAEIQRDGSGRVVALWPIHPSIIQADRTPAGSLFYRVNGTADLSPSDVFHVPGLSADSVVGWELLRIARESLGFSIAAEQYGQNYFRNAGNVGMFISHPGQLPDAARENIPKALLRR